MHRPWLEHYDSGVPAKIDYPEITLIEILESTANTHPDKSALNFFDTILTYKELWETVNAFALALSNSGLKKGDRIILLLPNSPQFVISYYGALLIGAVVVPINPLLTNRECLKILEDAKAETIIGLDILMPKVSKALDEGFFKRVLITRITDYLKPAYSFLYNLKNPFQETISNPDRFNSFLEAINLYRGRRTISRAMPDDVAVLIYTSGTTGYPKGVMLTHRNILANVYQCKYWIPNMDFGDEVFLGVLPFFHTYGMTTSMNLSIALGALNILLPKFSPKQVIKAIRKHRITVLPGVEAIYIALLEHEKKLARTNSLKICISGAGSLKKEVQEKFEKLINTRISEGYGLSETSPITHDNPLEGLRKIGSFGVPFPDTDAKIVDLKDSSKVLNTGEVGELLVCGPQVMKGYWQKPEETAAVLDKDGWFSTGDIVRMDNDGFFFFIGRKSGLIKVGGLNVYPMEVEEIICQHEKVKEVAIIGVPHDFWGECVKAFIVPENNEVVSKKEIADFCRDKLAPFKIPKEMKIIDELPKNFMGKVLKRELIKLE